MDLLVDLEIAEGAGDHDVDAEAAAEFGFQLRQQGATAAEHDAAQGSFRARGEIFGEAARHLFREAVGHAGSDSRESLGFLLAALGAPQQGRGPLEGNAQFADQPLDVGFAAHVEIAVAFELTAVEEGHIGGLEADMQRGDGVLLIDIPGFEQRRLERERFGFEQHRLASGPAQRFRRVEHHLIARRHEQHVHAARIEILRQPRVVKRHFAGIEGEIAARFVGDGGAEFVVTHLVGGDLFDHHAATADGDGDFLAVGLAFAQQFADPLAHDLRVHHGAFHDGVMRKFARGRFLDRDFTFPSPQYGELHRAAADIQTDTKLWPFCHLSAPR